ncbi:response regulator transcription factor [Aquabacterium sp.]|uniref:response regulator transcription factor n=1 Tax=Aquabacterium sp. TaxID=1872578 RepID=UPI003B75208C
MKPRIAIVEDDPDQLASTQEYLSAEGYPTWGVSNARDFYVRFAAEPVDVVILDIGLPGDNGLTIAEVLSKNPRVATIIVSARVMLDDRLSGLKAGADRYLVKPVDFRELAANIDAAAHRRHQAGSPPPAAVLPESAPASPTSDEVPWRLSMQTWTLLTPQGGALPLTTKEFALMQQLIRANGSVVSKKELLQEVFGLRSAQGSERLSVLVTRLRKKATDVLGESLPIRTAHQLGYAFTAPASLQS